MKCGFCGEGFGQRDPKVHMDKQVFHHYCVEAYLKSKGRSPKEAWKCPTGDHYHTTPDAKD